MVQDLGNVAGRQVGALPAPLGDELIAHFPISMLCPPANSFSVGTVCRHSRSQKGSLLFLKAGDQHVTENNGSDINELLR